MGKKRVIKGGKEELIKEGEKIDEKIKKTVKIKEAKRVREGKIYISSSYNNTVITLTDLKGNTLGWTSAGNIGFKGTKKATPFAASKVAGRICEIAQKIGMEKADIIIKGVGSGRESAIRSLATHGLDINSIKDLTPIPHNGCRPPKVRRV